MKDITARAYAAGVRAGIAWADAYSRRAAFERVADTLDALDALTPQWSPPLGAAAHDAFMRGWRNGARVALVRALRRIVAAEAEVMR